MLKARIRYKDKELDRIIEKDEVIPTKNKDRIKLLLDMKVAYEVEEPKKEPKASAEK
ncbi:MAG: hypothetical protein K6G88_05675 [Lachnospiraceae bacterium]|nr:hypothetical protein [Lachnospiraceae bacterium]